MDLISYIMGRNSVQGGNSGGGGASLSDVNILRYKYGMPVNEVGLVKLSGHAPTFEELLGGFAVYYQAHIDGLVDDPFFEGELITHDNSYEMDGMIYIGLGSHESTDYRAMFAVVLSDTDLDGLHFEKGTYCAVHFNDGLISPIPADGLEAFLIWDKK